MRLLLAWGALAFAAAAPAQTSTPSDWHFIPGSFEQGRGPDGNSVFLDAPDGLILVDTGRHPAHRDRLLDHAREKGRPIAAVFNTHWHLDHSTGNAEIRAAFPGSRLYTSNAIEGALTGFLQRNRASMQRQLEAGQVPERNRAEVQRAFQTLDNPAALRPDRAITRSGTMRIAGRRLRVNLASFAATEGDVWIHDRAARLVIAGDLVVAEVPFMDTACPEGWRRALDAIASTRFETLIPGHGAPMSRAQFLAWRAAFNNLLDCGASDRPKADCVAGWLRDASSFIAEERRQLISQYADYYIESRLRAAPDERNRYCAGGSG